VPLEPANEDVAVFSRFLYRAESLADEISKGSGNRATAIVRPDAAVLSGFGTVVIDMDTGLETTLELVRAITARRPQAQIVVSGIEESEEAVVRLAEAGASGYATQMTSLEDLIAIVRAVRNREFTCPPHITYALYAHLARLAGATREQRLPVLTIRERRVLDLLSQNMTNKEIAASLCISEYTAKNHVHRILKKLGWTSRNDAVASGLNRLPASPATARLAGF
jgi:DNA-binding NarL/FixJ family response regulator